MTTTYLADSIARIGFGLAASCTFLGGLCFACLSAGPACALGAVIYTTVGFVGAGIGFCASI